MYSFSTKMSFYVINSYNRNHTWIKHYYCSFTILKASKYELYLNVPKNCWWCWLWAITVCSTDVPVCWPLPVKPSATPSTFCIGLYLKILDGKKTQINQITPCFFHTTQNSLGIWFYSVSFNDSWYLKCFFFLYSIIELKWRNFLNCEKKKGERLGRRPIFENSEIYLGMKESGSISLDTSSKNVHDYSFNTWYEHNF